MHPQRHLDEARARFIGTLVDLCFDAFDLVVQAQRQPPEAQRSARAAPAMGPMPGRRRLAALALRARRQAAELLLALVDDLGGGDVQYNDPAMVTPELNSLARTA